MNLTFGPRSRRQPASQRASSAALIRMGEPPVAPLIDGLVCVVSARERVNLSCARSAPPNARRAQHSAPRDQTRQPPSPSSSPSPNSNSNAQNLDGSKEMGEQGEPSDGPLGRRREAENSNSADWSNDSNPTSRAQNMRRIIRGPPPRLAPSLPMINDGRRFRQPAGQRASCQPASKPAQLAN